MIPVGELVPHEKNFYDVSDVDGLVDAILMDGLQSPLVVNRGESGKYTIISGHRRYTALGRIISEQMPITAGKLFAEEISKGNVPCLVNQYQSDLQAELALIRANSDTRVLSSSEKSQQIERVEELLYQMKEQGYDFPGKMRDYVAEACQVSASKIARLKVIRDNLLPKFSKLYKKGTLRESAAYSLAKLSKEHQAKIYEVLEKAQRLEYIHESKIEQYGNALIDLDAFKCKQDKGCHCENKEKRFEKSISGYYSPCPNTCCGKCSQLSSCRNACKKFSEQIKSMKVDAREQRKQEQLAKQEREAPDIAEIQAIWERVGEARRQAGKSVEEFFKLCDKYYSQSYEADFLALEAGEGKVTTDTSLPFGYNFYLSYARKLYKVAEALGCSVDFLLCRTDDPAGAAPPAWKTGEYPKCTWLAILYRHDEADETLHRRLVYSNGLGTLYHGKGSDFCFELPPVAWYALPDYEVE